MQVKFNVFWKKNLGTLYKDNSIDTVGKEANVDIDLKQVHNIYATFKVGDKTFTDLVEIVDIETRLINIPFKTDVIKLGINELELVANMKNGSVMPSQTYTYTIDKSLENPNSVEAETNYPILIELLQEVGEKISDTDEAINRLDSSVEEMKNNINNSLSQNTETITNSLKENTNTINSHIKDSLDTIDNNFNEYVNNTNNDLNNKFKTYTDEASLNINTILDNKCNEVDNKCNEVDNKVNSKIQEVNSLISSVELSESIRQEEHNNKISELQNYSDVINDLESKVSINKQSIKSQNIILNGLYRENLDERLTITDYISSTELHQSKDGVVELENIKGNTLVNLITNANAKNLVSTTTGGRTYNLSTVSTLKANTTYTFICFASNCENNGKLRIRYTKQGGGFEYGAFSNAITDGIYTIKINFTTDIGAIMVFFDGSSDPIYRATVKFCLFEGDLEKYPSEHFLGFKSSFEDELITDELNENYLKYKVNYKTISEDFTNESTQSIYLNSPLLQYDEIVSYENKIYHKHKTGIREYIEGDIDSYITDNKKTLYELDESYYEILDDIKDKIVLSSFKKCTLSVNTEILPITTVTYSANIPVVSKLNKVNEVSEINTEDIAITQMAVDFLLMSSLVEEMINFKIKGGTNMSAYFASRIIKRALKYEDVIRKYPNYKEDIDLILVSEGYSDLIVEL